MKNKILQSTCKDCDKCMTYSEPHPKKCHGVTMRFGERFCLAQKKAQRFKKSDPKIKVPAWCPKRNSPPIVRVYGFKDENSHIMYIVFEKDSQCPSPHKYKVRHEGKTNITASDLLEDIYPRIEGTTIRYGEVIEIDDGIKPVFLFYTEKYGLNQTYFNKSITEK